MPKRKRSSDYCNAHAKRQKERRVRLSAFRRRRRTPRTEERFRTTAITTMYITMVCRSATCQLSVSIVER